MMAVLDKHGREINFRHLLVVLNIVREQFPAELGRLNNDILVNVLFLVTHKNLGRLVTVQDWFLELLSALVHGLRTKFLPSYFLKRLNLITVHNLSAEESNMAADKLLEMADAIKDNPKRIYDFAGYDEKKKGRGESSESESDSDNDDEGNDDDDDDDDKKKDGDDGAGNNSDDEVKPTDEDGGDGGENNKETQDEDNVKS